MGEEWTWDKMEWMNIFGMSSFPTSCYPKNPTIFYIICMGCWVTGTNDSSTKHLMFQVSFFFHNFLQNSLQILFQFILLFFYKFTNIKIKSFECPKSIRNYEKKNNAWNIRRLVDESFIPVTQQTSILY